MVTLTLYYGSGGRTEIPFDTKEEAIVYAETLGEVEFERGNDYKLIFTEKSTFIPMKIEQQHADGG